MSDRHATVIPYLSASSFAPKRLPTDALLDSTSLLISITSSRVRIAVLTDSIFDWRPFITLSALFSCLVPTKRWDGLQHLGLSHVWQTSMPLGTDIPTSSSATRVAGTCRPLSQNAPYPSSFLRTAASHGQHSVSDLRLTFDQNRTLSGGAFSAFLALAMAAPSARVMPPAPLPLRPTVPGCSAEPGPGCPRPSAPSPACPVRTCPQRPRWHLAIRKCRRTRQR